VYLNIKEVSYLKNLCIENVFEMTVVQLIDCKLVLVCIYQSPHSDFNSFLNKLEATINKVRKKR
jgi:hypothetical protein